VSRALRRIMLVSALVALAVTGCQSSSSASSPSLIKQIQKAGELKVGAAEYVPGAVKDPASGKWSGTFIDFATWYADQLGVKLTVVETSWDNIVAGLQAKQYDMALGLNRTPKRAIAVVFTAPLEYSLGGFAIKPDRVSARTWAQLNDPKYTICVVQGTAYDLALTNIAPKAQITRLPDHNACSLEITSDKVDAFWEDLGAVAPLAKEQSAIRLIIPDPQILSQGIATAVPQGYSFEDLEAINIGIENYIASGLLTKSQQANRVDNPLDYAVQP